MTNGEKIQSILNVDGDCTEVHGNNGTMTFTVTSDFWDSEYEEPTFKNDLTAHYISKEDAIKTIQRYGVGCFNPDEFIPEQCERFVIAKLNELNPVTLQDPRWIPTSERYPKIEDQYKYFLVTDDDGKVSVQEFLVSLDEEPQPYFSGMMNVIAWMPLPKSYKAESEK